MKGVDEKAGRCACGAVTFRSVGPWRAVINCHCESCRRTSGHFWAATAVPAESLVIEGEENLRWFRTTEAARRGFCKTCGSSLFYQHRAKPYIAIAAGCLDQPSGLTTAEEIFCHEKGDYYPLNHNLPNSDQWSASWAPEDEA